MPASLLPALLGDLVERAPLAVEHRRLSHVFLVAPANNIGVRGASSSAPARPARNR
jgi:hypothetical protein